MDQNSNDKERNDIPEKEPEKKTEEKKGSDKKQQVKKTNVSKGEMLKNERTAKGLSLESIHEATKIPMDALKAIEEGYTVRTLSPFYYNGFLKIYAEYLNIDVSQVVDDYKKEELPEYIKPENTDFDLGEWISKRVTKEQKQKAVIIVGILLVLFLIFKVITFFTSRPASEKKVAKTEATFEPAKPVDKPVVTEVKKKEEPPKPEPPKPQRVTPPPSPPPVVRASTPVTTPVVEKNKKVVTLTVRAIKKSWLRVKVDGEIVFQSSLREGTAETWRADKAIEIEGKNINQLEFELNGKLLGTLGRKDRKAKKIFITKDGLKVSK